MKFKIILLITIFTSSCFFLTGCAGQYQLSQRFDVKGIGVDLSDGEYHITLQGLDFQNPKSKDEPNLKTLEVSGNSVMEALSKIQKQSGLNPLYSQNLIIIIGEDLAKKEAQKFIDFFIRHVDTRPRVKICISEGKAKEILNLKFEGKLINAKDTSEIISDSLNSDVLHFVGNLKSNISSPYAASLKIENSKIVKSGIAVFKDDILAEILKKEAFGFNILKGVPKLGSCIIETEKTGKVTCNIEKCSSEIKCEIEENFPIFKIDISIGVTIFEFDNDFYTHENEEIKNLIEQKITEKILKECVETIDKLTSLNCDVLNFGKCLRNQQNSYSKANQKELENLMKNSKFEVNPSVKVIVTGKEPI